MSESTPRNPVDGSATSLTLAATSAAGAGAASVQLEEDLIGAVVVRKDDDGVITARYERTSRPVPGAGELLVEPAYAGICGTDIEQLHGRMPESFQINFPHTLGHEWSGRVIAVGAEVDRFAPGDRVLGHGHLGGNEWFGVTHNGAMADVFVVPEVMCFRVPDSVSLETAAVIEPFACVLNALTKIGGISAADTLHVYGLGAIGLSVVLQAVTAHAAVVAYDPSELRRTLALRLGASAALNPLEPDLAGRTAAAVGRPLADVVVEASGVPAAQSMAIESADEDGRVLLMGVSTPRHEPARLGLVQSRNLTITSSTGAPPSIWPSAIAYVENAKIDLRPFVSSVLSFDECEEAITRAQNSSRETKVLLRPATDTAE